MARPANKLKTNTFKEKEKSNQTANKKSAATVGSKKGTKPGRHFPFKKLIGIFLVFVAIYLALAFTSFFVNWFNQVTDDVIADMPISRLLTDIELNISNWTGNLGAFFAQFFVKEVFGLGAYFLVFLLLILGIHLGAGLNLIKGWTLWKYGFLSLLWLPLLLAFIFRSDPLNVLGGVLGHYLHIYLKGIIGTAGIIITLIFTFATYVILEFNLTFNRNRNAGNSNQKQTKNTKPSPDLVGDKYNTIEYAVDDEEDSGFEKPEIGTGNNLKNDDSEELGSVSLEVDLPLDDKAKQTEAEEEEIEFSIEPVKQEETRTKGTIDRQGLDTQFDPTLDLPDYQFPHLDLLTDYGEGGISVERSELEANKVRIVETLANYSIGIEKIKATIGPTVTLYEIIPAAGVRIARIKGLEDDIALSLSAIGIRIIAPIPGKGTVGIEVPNQKPEIVSMRTIIGSEKFSDNKFELPFGLGKTIANESFVADLAKMPHILMAGATGQGKSVGLNAIIASLLYCKHPAELKFVMVDPKKVELSLFSRIERHYLAKLPDSEEAIITDTRKVVRTLNSLSIEMDNRYELLKDAQVRNIKEYNVKFKSRKLNPMHGHRFLPYIVLVVDEFADLIMTAGKEIESPITRLAQLARAVGIHLIIATQRPSVNIITGTIKANFPARIAFRVISGTDSRTILDTKGADQLIGRGDMLLSTGSDLVRLQCAFIDTPEVERLTEFIGSQRGYPDAYHLPEFAEEQDEAGDVFDATERDELFEDAARIIVQTQQGSTSLLQRKLKLGYNRAGRIIDQLEAAGIVGPFEGSKAREVKVANEMALEQFLKDLDMPNIE
ncbi:MAG: DNA translocase FtsK 4TM domain-containing protein [Bacteroidales bacterium]|nr:DNA translocase FtsK 4TM domain-containing protein [Bacteroidales bacterium]